MIKIKSDNSVRSKLKKLALSTISSSNRSNIKCSYGPSESDEHRNTKCIIGRWAYKNSVKFCTEAVFNNGGRADIVLLDFGIAIEVLHSEKLSSFIKKNYPIPTIPVKTSMSKTNIEIMLDDILALNGDADYYIKKLSKEDYSD